MNPSYSSLYVVMFLGKTTFKRPMSGKVFNFPHTEFSVLFTEDKDDLRTGDLRRKLESRPQDGDGCLHTTSD